MTVAAFRNSPIDRRRLNMYDRSQYKPQERLEALARAKRFKGNLAYRENRKPFATEQSPGTGGFTLGRDAQAQRNFDAGSEKMRAESFRPEKAISNSLYSELFQK